MSKKASNPLKITDLTFRDGHQSIFATRIRTEDLVAIAPEVNKVGFWSAEVWGGATFDVMTRFLNEDPWERIRILKKLMPDTRLQMLLRGQNLVGYRNYADDVVTAFIYHAADCGIDTYRVFDAVNDERNFITAYKAIKEKGKHIQGCLSYSLTEQKLGGPVYNIDYFVNKAKIIQDMGADSLCIKDMAGLISPDDAYDLIKALKQALKIPVSLHSHFTSGMAQMSMLKAAEAGADMIDTCIAPLALRTSHPAIEPMVLALQGTPRDTGLQLQQLIRLGDYFETIAPKYRDFMDNTKISVIDSGVLGHQIPGGMYTNMVDQLKEANALDRLQDVFHELPRTRKELGYPPLVTPTSQIIGTQAVLNVLFGRYKKISEQVKDYVYGLYGRAPVPIDAEVQKKVLLGYSRGDTPITCRPADTLAPELDKAKEATKDIARDIGDVLIYALYPTTGMRFLRWKYGLENPPPETKGKTLQDISRENDLINKAKSGALTEKVKVTAKGTNARKFNVYINNEAYQVEVEAVGSSVALPAAPPGELVQVNRPVKDIQQPSYSGIAPIADKIISPGETPITAPMPGLIVRYLVNEGDNVKENDRIAVLEAMKMENEITSPVAGKVKALVFKNGDRVKKDEIIAIIG